MAFGRAGMRLNDQFRVLRYEMLLLRKDLEVE